MSTRDRSAVLLVVGGAALGALTCALGGFMASLFVGGSYEAGPALQSVPDRFVELELEEDMAESPAEPAPGVRARREEGRVAKKDAMMDKAMGESAGVLGGMGTGARGSGLGGGGTAEGIGGMKSAPEKKPEAPAAAMRSWFPETFLWAPRVRTDAQGEAEVSVTVPDQLSSWRVLGLSAADDGSVSGATLTFDSVQEVFVEPASVPFLRVGDRLELPVRVGNLGTSELRGGLRLRGERLSGGLSQAVRVPAGRSAVLSAPFSATEPGTAVLEATLDGRDTVVREVEVLPRGRRILTEHRGLLGGTQSVTLALPPGATSARVSTTVVPGPAGVLRAELAVGHRGAPRDLQALARSVALGAMGPALLERLGQPSNEAEARSFRALRLRAQPGLVKETRSRTDLVGRSLALVALEAAGEDPLAAPLAAQTRQRLLGEQRPDGSWPVPDGASLDRLVATTAWLSLVLDDPTARVRAEAVFERFLPALLEQPDPDPYTLALLLAATELPEERRAEVVARIEAGRAALADDPELYGELVRLDGAALTPADLHVALGLAGLEPAAAALAVQGWSPGEGLGDPLTTVGWLRLLSQAEAVSSEAFEVRLSTGGESATLTVSPGSSVAGAVLPLEVGSEEVGLTVSTEAAQTAVGWLARVEAWVPWEPQDNALGLLAELEHDELVVGRAAEVRLYLEGPEVAGVDALVRLPAGVQALEEGLEGATWVTRADGELRLTLPDQRDARHEVRFTVVPALGGQLWSGATVVSVPAMGAEALVLPTLWRIRG